jgi:hypothetical protein
VGAILAEPDKYEGKIFCAATALYTVEEMTEIISKVSGKTVVHQQVLEEQFRRFLPQNGFADLLVEMMYQQDFGFMDPVRRRRLRGRLRMREGG